MKNTRKLIPALAMLLVSAVLMSTASFAWFSMNKTATVTGMQVNATATGSLVVSTTYNATDWATAASFSGGTTLAPCTYTTPAGQTAGYWYVNNPTAVDSVTGNAMTGATLEYAAVPAGGVESESTTGKIAGTYYKDFIVYIAATGAEIANQQLKATVTFTKGDNTDEDTGWKALTVDFFTPGATTLSAAYTGYTVTHSKTVNATGSTTVTVETLLESATTIPVAGATAGRVVPMVIRVYFDGALQNSGSAYVNSKDGNISDVKIDVLFEAVGA